MQKLTLLLLSTTLLGAENFSSSLSSQGFTGLINTPNAQVIKEGNAVFQFNNQFDNHSRGYDYSKAYQSEENYIAGIGFLSSSEFIGRLVESPGYARDLAANIKFQIPYHHPYLPDIAFGLQDIGGADNHYDNTYVVADKEMGFIRASLGYGKAGENIQREFGVNKRLAKRMDGIFGGVEAKVTDYLSILAEHDGQENHAGLRMAVPQNLLSSVKLEATLAQNLTEPQTHFSINLTVPLFPKNYKVPYPQSELSKKSYTQNSSINSAFTPQKRVSVNSVPDTKNPLLMIQNKLVKFGFQNVQVGKYEGSIYIKFENNMFDHTDLDALGYVIGSIASEYSTNKHYIVTLLKNNLQTITLSGDSEKFDAYLKKPTLLKEKEFSKNLTFSRSFDEKDVVFISSQKNSSMFKPRIELSPGLLTTVGTEIGVFDYLATLRANVYMPVCDGVVVSAMHETPLFNSENFNADKPYGIRNANRLKSRLVTAMVHQTSHYDALFNTVSLGQYQADYYGVMNQTHLSTTSGDHGVALKVGAFQNKDSTIKDDRKVYLGSYRYFYEPLNLFSEITYGKYWHQDTGVTLQFKRFFNQTSVALYLQDVGYKYAGVRVTIPLTSRKLYNSKIVQLEGKGDFNYAIRTTLKEPTGGNIQRPNGGVIPKNDFELANTYLDRDRLNGSYIQGNVARMRDAYIEYGL